MRRTNGQKKTPLEFATHEPLFRQGHVGDLQTKSRIEVIELLERQEKLLANRYFNCSTFCVVIGTRLLLF